MLNLLHRKSTAYPLFSERSIIVLFGVGNGEEPQTVRESEGDPPGLVDRVVGKGARDRKGSASTGLDSSKETLCFFWFAAALTGSQVTRMG